MADTYKMEGAEAGPQESRNHGNRDVHRPVRRCSEISPKESLDQACVWLERKRSLFSPLVSFPFFFFNELARQGKTFCVLPGIFMCLCMLDTILWGMKRACVKKKKQKLKGIGSQPS